jgi:predicted enzyme related to lactoylglutathione lyase
VAADWRTLADFYEQAFGCTPVPPPRDLAGEWLERGTGLPGAHLYGIHLRLPGSDDGPTLEIFGYSRIEPRPSPIVANRTGLAHLAFLVDDVHEAARLVLALGGSLLGEVSTSEVDGVGRLTFVYAADPEGNVVELQSWE